jgi:hypothetical protein
MTLIQRLRDAGEAPLLPCPHCGCEDIRHDHPTRAPRVYCALCRSTAESPLVWNSRPEDWYGAGGIIVASVSARLSAHEARHDG